MASKILDSIAAQFVANTGVTPLQYAEQFGKGSPALIEELNKASAAAATGTPFVNINEAGGVLGKIAPVILGTSVAVAGGSLLGVPIPGRGGQMNVADFAGLFATSLLGNGTGFASQSLQGPATGAEVSILGRILGGIAAGAGIEAGKSIMSQVPQEAPKASLIMGTCPPGRVRKTVAWGRDICIKKPTMNPLNPKALRRATTRISRFHAFAQKAEKEMAKAFRKGGFHVSTGSRSRTKCGTCKKTACSCR